MSFCTFNAFGWAVSGQTKNNERIFKMSSFFSEDDQKSNGFWTTWGLWHFSSL